MSLPPRPEPERAGPDLTDEELESVGRAVELDDGTYRHCPKCDGQLLLRYDWGVWMCTKFTEHCWKQGRFHEVDQ